MMAKKTLHELLSPDARTNNGRGDPIKIGGGALAATLEVSKASVNTAFNPPKLKVFLEDAPTPEGPWTFLATFGTRTGPGIEVSRVPHSARHDYIRVRWSIAGAGNPAFVFSVKATVTEEERTITA